MGIAVLEMKLNVRDISIGLLLFAVPICMACETDGQMAFEPGWYVSWDKYDWYSAHEYCVRHHMQLFEPTTKTGCGETDLLVVTKKMKLIGGKTWLGIVNIEDSRKMWEGETVKFNHWVTSSDWEKFKHNDLWINGKYSNTSGSVCTYGQYGYNGLGETKDCTQKMKFVCQPENRTPLPDVHDEE